MVSLFTCQRMYVIDELPNGVDLLIGMDQIGNQFGINIPLDGFPTISIRSKGQVDHYKLERSEDGKSLHTDFRPDFIPISQNYSTEPGSVLLLDGEKEVGNEVYSSEMVVTGEAEVDAKCKSKKKILKPASDQSIPDDELTVSNQPADVSSDSSEHTREQNAEIRIDKLSARRGPPIIEEDEIRQPILD